MIPKIIHYCWFGGKPLDEMAQKCINSWKIYFPEYEIIQWNEKNFDITQMDFMEKAYKDEKWAFVSDVVRLIVIYKFGGVYFDTDVEVISEYSDILKENTSGFLGIEKLNVVSTGLGYGAVPAHPFIKALINIYEKIDYDEYVKHLEKIACPVLTTKLLVENGYIIEDRIQDCCGFTIYPSDYFSPIDYKTGKMKKTQNTHSIHWYNVSWNTEQMKRAHIIEQRLYRVFGEKIGGNVYGIISCIKKEGIVAYVLLRLKKILFMEKKDRRNIK